MGRVIGITGGIASGKSNVCNVLRELGYKIIDCDEITFNLSKKGNILHKEIINYFGSEYLLEDGELDKKKLGSVIFNDQSKREALDRITHPIIKDELLRELKEYSNEEVIFVEVPLLYESKFNLICDFVVCVYLDKNLQIQRLMEREGISYEFAKRKVESQMDLKVKGQLADYVIISNGSFEETRVQVLAFIGKLKGGNL